MDKLYILVGDEYANFAQHSNVFTVSQLIEALEGAHIWNGDEKVIFGLGISKSARDFLTTVLNQRGVEEIMSEGTLALAPAHLTHKKRLENTLITAPRKIQPLQYEFYFHVDNRMDRLSDHVSGRHLSGMLMVEANRQATIAALELEYGSEFDEKYGIVVEQFACRFHNYAFPIPTLITVNISEIGRSINKNISVECMVTFSQAHKEVCSVHSTCSIPRLAQLDVVESRMARSSINALRNKYEALAVAG